MNTFNAIHFTSPSTLPQRSELSVEKLLDLHCNNTPPATSVFMLCDENLEKLTSPDLDKLLSKKRVRNPAKQLTHYFSSNKCIQRLTAPYKTPGQAQRSVNAFLKLAGGDGKARLCLLGVPVAVFGVLWTRAVAPETAPPSDESIPLFDGDYARLLREKTEGIKMSDGLKAAYLGDSVAADLVRRQVVCAAGNKVAVLIIGESGTGKEIVAHQIHLCNEKPKGEFIAVNCSAIPTELFEGELFGFMKGSHDKAYFDKKGMWTLADKGTLFLDEIGDLSITHQAKILRAIEDGNYYPVGSRDPKPVQSDARIIAATNRNLAKMVNEGKFREDLYYRLFNFPIRTPALREHRDDIPILANHFWAKLANDNGNGTVAPLPIAVTEELKTYNWFGNARELRAFLSHVYLLSTNRPPDVRHIRTVMRERIGGNAPLRTESDR
jgi:hypothetical protein